MFNGLREKQIEASIIPRKGSKAMRDGSVRDDVVRALRNAAESFLLG